MLIYSVLNKINNKRYIGQTIRNFKPRVTQHFYDALVRVSNNPFHCALRKYGKDSFEWAVLEECGDIETLNFREQCYIAEFGTLAPYGYNLKPGGENHSCNLISRKKISNSLCGRSQSIESNIKRSISLSGERNHNYRKSPSLDTRSRLSLTLTGKKLGEDNPNSHLSWKEVKDIRYTYSLGNISQRNLAKRHGVDQQTVWSIVNNKTWK
jgi:group I intron endonuclease